MNKAILVIDMPNGCNECDIMCPQYYATIKKEKLKCGMKPHNCPLKPMPEHSRTGKSDYYQWGDWEDGWNACIDGLLLE